MKLLQQLNYNKFYCKSKVIINVVHNKYLTFILLIMMQSIVH